jgi:hypothetical protein
VRWGCCGNTDKRVFGCPVASDEQVEKLTVEEHLSTDGFALFPAALGVYSFPLALQSFVHPSLLPASSQPVNPTHRIVYAS